MSGSMCPYPDLTEKEVQVIQYIALGWTEDMIGRKLRIRQRAVRFRTAKAKQKLGCGRRALGLYYVKHILPKDRALLAEWTERSREARSRIRQQRGLLRQWWVIPVTKLITDERYCESLEVIRDRLRELYPSNKPPSERTMRRAFARLYSCIVGPPSLDNLATTCSLAPLDVPGDV